MTGVGILGTGVILKVRTHQGSQVGTLLSCPLAVLEPAPTPGEGASCAGGRRVSRQGCRQSWGAALTPRRQVN